MTANNSPVGLQMALNTAPFPPDLGFEIEPHCDFRHFLVHAVPPSGTTLADDFVKSTHGT